MNKRIWIGIAVAAVAVFLLVWQTREKQPGVVKIGAVFPLTGDAGPYGQNTKKGVLAGLDRANRLVRGKGFTLEVIFEDSKALPRDGASAAQKLISIDKVPAIIDDSVSSVTLAMAPIAERRNVVILSTGATSPAISKAGRYVFRIWNSDTLEGGVMAGYARKTLGLSKIAILYINNEYGIGLRDVFRERFSETGGTIVRMEAFAQGATDIRTQLANIAAAGPQAIYLVGYPAEAKRIFRQAKELGISVPWLGTVVMLEEQLLSLVKELRYVLYYPAPPPPTPQSNPVLQFQEDFRRVHGSGQKPPVLADVGYDSIIIIGLALQRSGDPTGQGIRTGLEALPPYDGASGHIQFDKNGDVSKPIEIKRVGPGG